MKRKSLSASLGSWYVQLAYNPRRAEENPRPSERANETATDTLHLDNTVRPWALLMPAFSALAIGAGAACYALSHFITYGSWTIYLLGALLLVIFISAGACCGGPSVRWFCRAVRWPLVIIVLGVAVSTHFNSFLPSEAEGESNTIVALLVGLVCILSVLLVGARSGARCVPLSAPLVPCLSLFGLLCLITVDTAIQVCFVLFVAASLYLLSYDRFLRLCAPELATGIAFAAPMPSHPHLTVVNPGGRECWRWASQSLLVSGVWFALFMAGGALFYLPVQAILPRLVSPQLNRMRVATQGYLLDYRGSAVVMELHGGDYTLSDREIMRITVNAGEPSGLWRGRVYEHYERSCWQEDGISGLSPFGGYKRPGYPRYNSSGYNGSPNRRAVNDSPSYGARRLGIGRGGSTYSRSHYSLVAPRRLKAKPSIDPQLGEVSEVLEYVEPVEMNSSVLYSSGQPISWRERPEVTQFDFGNADYSQYNAVDVGNDGFRPHSPYLIRSFVVRPHMTALQDAPGYEKILPQDAARRTQFTSDLLRRNLQMPADPEARRVLRAIATQITIGQKRRPVTPYDKVRAINGYLTQNALYSLHSPAVPSTKDAVIFFLTDSRQGACDMFSSSMALLLRTMNVPARVVTGYLQPEFPVGSSAASDPEAFQRPTWLVKERDAHAWVEYYVPGLGWLSYDPTAGTRTAETLPFHIVGFFKLPHLNIPTSYVVLPAVGLLLLGLGIVWPRVEKRFFGPRAFDSEANARRRIVKAYNQAQHRMRRRVPSQAHLTPQEYEARVSHSRLPLAVKQEFAALTHLYIAARYGTIPNVSANDLDRCVTRLQNAMRGKKAELRLMRDKEKATR